MQHQWFARARRSMTCTAGCVALVLGVASMSAAEDKCQRVVAIFDITVRFSDPAIRWKEISDAFVSQVLVDQKAESCIKTLYMPQRILDNPKTQTPANNETGGIDYFVSGEMFKSGGSYYYEASLVTGEKRLTVAKVKSVSFTDPREAVPYAKSVALKLRETGGGTRALADVIYDFEKKVRAEKPRDHAIGATLTLNEQGLFDAPIRMKAGESRTFSLTLVDDCDKVPLKGAAVFLEVVKGLIEPMTVIVDGSGKGTFTYTAPKENRGISVRIAFDYLRGSERPGAPREVRFLELQIGQVSTYTGTITYRLVGSVTGQRGPGHTFPSNINETATFTGTFRRESADAAGEAWRVVSGTATATIDDQIDEVDQGTSQRTTKTGTESVSIPEAALRLVFAKDGKSYSLHYTKVVFNKMQYTIYEAGDPKTVFQEASPLTWFPPAFTFDNIAMPADGEVLTGKRRIKVPVLLVGVGAQMEAEVSWSLKPAQGSAGTR